LKVRNIALLLVVLVALGGVYLAFARSKDGEPPKKQVYVWDIQMDDLQRIEIALPRDGKSQSFIKIKEGDKFPWYFDDPQKSPVDSKRWGGGIPLLLSGPGADRIITDNATAEQFAEYGLAQPRMEITLTMTDGQVMKITVGDATPSGINYYVRAPGTNAVATVDFTWYNVMEALVTNPPYATTAS
jgi:hypothetical protein